MERIKEAIARAHSATSRRSGFRSDVGARMPSSGKDALEVPVLKSVTLDRKVLKRRRLVAADPSDPLCAPYDMLRTRVVQVMRDNNWHTLAITSPNPQSGKTTTAINLALSMGRLHERKTILVDLDLRNPTVLEYLGLYNGVKISDVISGDVSIAEVMIKHESSNLYVIPCGSTVQHSSELLASRPMSRFIGKLRDDFPEALILFDLPPMLLADDALSVLPHMDAVMLVAAAYQTRISDLNECEQKLRGANYLGVVLNKVDSPGNAYRSYLYRS